jgi:hypothetical protein
MRTLALALLAPTTDEAFCAEQAATIRLLGRRVVSDIIEIGSRLIAVRERRGHGGWLSWLTEEFGWDVRTAQRYIQASEAFAKYDTVSRLAGCDIDAGALYALAAPAVPDEVREQAVEKAAAGEHITKADAEQMVSAAQDAAIEAGRAAGKTTRQIAKETGVDQSTVVRRGKAGDAKAHSAETHHPAPADPFAGMDPDQRRISRRGSLFPASLEEDRHQPEQLAQDGRIDNKMKWGQVDGHRGLSVELEDQGSGLTCLSAYAAPARGE